MPCSCFVSSESVIFGFDAWNGCSNLQLEISDYPVINRKCTFLLSSVEKFTWALHGYECGWFRVELLVPLANNTLADSWDCFELTNSFSFIKNFISQLNSLFSCASTCDGDPDPKANTLMLYVQSDMLCWTL